MKLEKEIIDEVEKHHNMKMSEECVKGLLKILKKHCPHYNKCCENKTTSDCKCDPCECDPCKCGPCKCDPCECDPCKC